MAGIIMLFNMLHIHRFSNARLLVKITQIVREVGVINNAAQIAFKMAHIDGIKPDQCGEQPPIRFGDIRAGKLTGVG